MTANGTRMQMPGLHNVHIQPLVLATCQQEGIERQKKNILAEAYWCQKGHSAVLKQVAHAGILIFPSKTTVLKSE